MKEKIIFVNKLNATELLRTATVNRGNLADVCRFFSENELLDYVMTKRAIYLPGTPILGEDVIGTILLSATKPLEYEDAQNLKHAFESYQECVIFDVIESLKKILSDDFPQKKDVLINGFKQYQAYKETHNLYDKFDVIRHLLSLDWTTKLEEVVTFKEFSLTKTQKLFLKTFFSDVKVESIKDFVKNEQSTILEVVKAYGSINEISAVINTIHDQHLPLGKCQVVLVNANDVYHLINKIDVLSLTSIKKIAVTFRQGYPLLLTRPGQMLLAIKKLAKGLYGLDAYDYLFEAKYFNTQLIRADKKERWWSDFKKYVGWLRLNFEQESVILAKYDEDGMEESLVNFNEDIKAGIPQFIKKYCLISENLTDQAAIKTIENVFALLTKYRLSNAKIIDVLLRKNITPTLSAPHALHVTTLDCAFESNRPYTFIIGLTSDYPGQAIENCLIFDDEFKKIDEEGYFSSNQTIERKKNLLTDFVSISGQTYLSYPFYRLADQKDINPSFIITEVNPSAIKEISFADDGLSKLHHLIDDYQNNFIMENRLLEIIRPTFNPELLLAKKFSPSTMATYFFGNKLVFILNVLFNLNLSDESDPFEIIPVEEKGTLLHLALNNYQDGDDKQLVRDYALDLLRNFLKKKPSALKENVANLESDFMHGLEVLLSMQLGKEAECEKYYLGTINGLVFGGMADRIAVIGDKHVLIDYKTGRRSKHDSNKLETFIQGLIYAELITHQNSKWSKIDEIWFIYPYESEEKRIAKITFDENARQTLYHAIEEIKNLIKSGDFRVIDDDNDKKEMNYTDQYTFLFCLYEQLALAGGHKDGAE